MYHIAFFILSALVFTACAQSEIHPGRTKVPFDFQWKFALGDFPDASNPGFEDASWRQLHVPHDWSIEGRYDSLNPAGIAGTFLPTGIGWYRKTFDYDPNWKGKRVVIQFDGVYLNSTVWINGYKLGFYPNGYLGFEYDLTPHLTTGKNTIAVKVDHERAPTGRWYTGSGIYRHVNLLVTNTTYIPTGGVFIKTPAVSAQQAEVSVEVEVAGDPHFEDLVASVVLLNPEGKVVGKEKTPLASAKMDVSFELLKPALWSVENPALYTAEIRVQQGEQMVDEVAVPFGVRKVDISTEGLFLNDKKTILKGVCMHHDAGPVGAAVPVDVLYDRLKKLKTMGCNAIRTSHNPFAPEFYAMCDSMGFLVMDEAFDGWEKEKATYDYGLYFEEWWQKDLTTFIKRDRNHPSVIMWSIGNEVIGWTPETQQMLVEHVKALDPTRAVTQGRGYAGTATDIAGFNGHGELKGALESFHQSHSDVPVIGTEITHSYQTRGVYRSKTWYRVRDFPAPWEIKNNSTFEKVKDKVYHVEDLTDEEVFSGTNPTYQSSYDNSLVRMNIRDYWKTTRDKPWFLGAFRWTGFDYLGESFGWPARTMSFGVIDLAGFPTDSYYLYQSIWADEPMVHMLPHWTHPGKEGVEIPVVVYTNCASAELFLNDVSLGKKHIDDNLQLTWLVPYEEGQLRVEATTAEGRLLSKTYRSAGAPAAVQLSLNRSVARPNNSDVIIVEASITDSEGVEVPHANHLVHFEVAGPGKIIGVENGDILDLSPHKTNQRKAFNGKCMLLVQTTTEPGELTITASSAGLEAGTVVISVQPENL